MRERAIYIRWETGERLNGFNRNPGKSTPTWGFDDAETINIYFVDEDMTAKELTDPWVVGFMIKEAPYFDTAPLIYQNVFSEATDDDGNTYYTKTFDMSSDSLALLLGRGEDVFGDDKSSVDLHCSIQVTTAGTSTMTSAPFGCKIHNNLWRSSGEATTLPIDTTLTGISEGTVVWADDAARALKIPVFEGQYGTQLDTEKAYIATGTSAGEWRAIGVGDVFTDAEFRAALLDTTISTITIHGSIEHTTNYQVTRPVRIQGGELKVPSGGNGYTTYTLVLKSDNIVVDSVRFVGDWSFGDTTKGDTYTRAIVTSNNTPLGRYHVRINNCYFTKHFTGVYHQGPTLSAPDNEPVHYVTNCKFEYMGGSAIYIDMGLAEIGQNIGAELVASGNDVYNIAGNGFWFKTKKAVVTGNSFRGIGRIGAELFYGRSAIISNNRFKDCDSMAISVAAEDLDDRPYAVVSGNLIEGHNSYAIEMIGNNVQCTGNTILKGRLFKYSFGNSTSTHFPTKISIASNAQNCTFENNQLSYYERASGLYSWPFAVTNDLKDSATTITLNSLTRVPITESAGRWEHTGSVLGVIPDMPSVGEWVRFQIVEDGSLEPNIDPGLENWGPRQPIDPTLPDKAYYIETVNGSKVTLEDTLGGGTNGPDIDCYDMGVYLIKPLPFTTSYGTSTTKLTVADNTTYQQLAENRKVRVLTGPGGTLPSGLSEGVDYYVRNMTGSGSVTFGLSASSGGAEIDLGTDAVGNVGVNVWKTQDGSRAGVALDQGTRGNRVANNTFLEYGKRPILLNSNSPIGYQNSVINNEFYTKTSSIDGIYVNAHYSTTIDGNILHDGVFCTVNGASIQTYTATVANPTVITDVSHGLIDDDVIRFVSKSPGGEYLHTGLSPDTDYYVVKLTDDTFSLRTAAGGGGTTVGITALETFYVDQYYEKQGGNTIDGVFNSTGNMLPNGTALYSAVSPGKVPTGLGGTPYYVFNSLQDTFQIEATLGSGTPIVPTYSGFGGFTFKTSASYIVSMNTGALTRVDARNNQVMYKRISGGANAFRNIGSNNTYPT